MDEYTNDLEINLDDVDETQLTDECIDFFNKGIEYFDDDEFENSEIEFSNAIKENNKINQKNYRRRKKITSRYYCTCLWFVFNSSRILKLRINSI